MAVGKVFSWKRAEFAKSVISLVLAGLFAISISHDVRAQTLEKVRVSGQITIGYFDSQVPFSYLDADKKPVGYSIDICHLIVERVKVSTGLASVRVRYIPVTIASRTALIANGTVDLGCGIAINTPDRQQYVAFSNTIFVGRYSIVSRKQAAYETLSDLKGKRVVLTAGTVTGDRVTEIALRERLGITFIPAKNPPEGFKLFESEGADAYISSETSLISLIARSKNGKSYTLSQKPLWIDPFAIVIRKGDLQLKELANAVIADLFKSGEITELYSRWFESPIPPDGIALQLPMSPHFKKLLRNPTDSARSADYE